MAREEFRNPFRKAKNVIAGVFAGSAALAALGAAHKVHANINPNELSRLPNPGEGIHGPSITDAGQTSLALQANTSGYMGTIHFTAGGNKRGFGLLFHDAMRLYMLENTPQGGKVHEVSNFLGLTTSTHAFGLRPMLGATVGVVRDAQGKLKPDNLGHIGISYKDPEKGFPIASAEAVLGGSKGVKDFNAYLALGNAVNATEFFANRKEVLARIHRGLTLDGSVYAGAGFRPGVIISGKPAQGFFELGGLWKKLGFGVRLTAGSKSRGPDVSLALTVKPWVGPLATQEQLLEERDFIHGLYKAASGVQRARLTALKSIAKEQIPGHLTRLQEIQDSLIAQAAILNTGQATSADRDKYVDLKQKYKLVVTEANDTLQQGLSQLPLGERLEIPRLRKRLNELEKSLPPMSRLPESFPENVNDELGDLLRRAATLQKSLDGFKKAIDELPAPKKD
ncbi:MAG TPA: hypothetical protein VGQ00_04155 [Candidatus Norongarragalinales archaeon]|nr:hypothetical protein [Candidatus Norongarragalinales archaeon]